MKSNTKGFSLPELLIVVAIIGIISSMAVPGLLQAQRAAREAAAIQTLRTLTTAENMYLSSRGSYQVYGDASALASAQLLTNNLLTAPLNGYQMALVLASPATNYTATSEPVSVSPNGHFYFTSNDGTIHWHAGSSAGPGDPPIPQ